MLAIDQIKEMCREYRETTSRADNSLRELMTQMRAVRRQEVGLLVKFLTVNRTLLEIKRDTQRTLVRQSSDGRRPSLDLQSSRLAAAAGGIVQASARRSLPDFTPPESLASERVVNTGHGGDRTVESVLSTQRRENLTQEETQAMTAERDGSHATTREIDERAIITLNGAHNIKNSPRWSTEDNQKLREIPEHREFPCGVRTESGDNPTTSTVCEVCRRSRSFSCDSAASRRESGYESCTEVEGDERSGCRPRASSSSSVVSSTSSSLSSSSSSRSSFSSQLSLSPPISASISSLLF